MLNDKLKNGRYEFISKVCNLPSCRTISEYNSVGGISSDGIIHDVLKKLRSNLDGDGDNWHSMFHLNGMHVILQKRFYSTAIQIDLLGLLMMHLTVMFYCKNSLWWRKMLGKKSWNPNVQNSTCFLWLVTGNKIVDRWKIKLLGIEFILSATCLICHISYHIQSFSLLCPYHNC